MNDFSISLDLLEHGWADISISDATQEETFTASYVGEDALSNLIDTAIRLSNGQGSTISFYLEPEIVSWQINVHDDNCFALQIGKLKFHGSIKRYIRQILRLFDSYLLLHSENDYRAQWGHVFPHIKLAHLRSLLRSRR